MTNIQTVIVMIEVVEAVPLVMSCFTTGVAKRELFDLMMVDSKAIITDDQKWYSRIPDFHKKVYVVILKAVLQ